MILICKLLLKTMDKSGYKSFQDLTPVILINNNNKKKTSTLTKSKSSSNHLNALIKFVFIIKCCYHRKNYKKAKEL
jgi:hypothetical protein